MMVDPDSLSSLIKNGFTEAFRSGRTSLFPGQRVFDPDETNGFVVFDRVLPHLSVHGAHNQSIF